MKIIVSGRQTGRTTQLIEMCHAAEAKDEMAYIVCASHNQAYNLAKMAQDLGKPVPFPLLYDDLLYGKTAGSRIKHIYMDNADYFLKRLIPVGATLDAIVLEERPEQ